MTRPRVGWTHYEEGLDWRDMTRRERVRVVLVVFGILAIAAAGSVQL